MRKTEKTSKSIKGGFGRLSFSSLFAGSALAFTLFSSLQLHAITKEWAIGDQGVAYPQTSIEARYNPAGILDVGNRFDATLGIVYANGHVKISGSSIPAFNQCKSNSQAKWVPLGILGISKQLSSCTAISLNLDSTRTFKASSRPGFRAFGTGNYGADLKIPILVPTFAWKWQKHNFGVSLPIIIGRAKFNGLQNFEPFSIAPNKVTNKGYNYAYGLTVRAGWLWHVTSDINLGVSYTPALLTASHFHKYKGLIPKHGLLEVAPNLRVGAAYRINNCAHLAFEFERNFFKQTKTISNPVDSPAPAGSKHGPANGWNNINAYKIGGDFKPLDDLTLRAGYVYADSYITPSNAVGNVGPTIFLVKSALNFGCTWEVKGYELDFTYSHFFYRKVRGKPAASLAGGHITLSQYTDIFFVGLGKKF